MGLFDPQMQVRGRAHGKVQYCQHWGSGLIATFLLRFHACNASYKPLVIISQGCATEIDDCLCNHTVEALIRHGAQAYTPA
jgi:hypothetical protein